MIIKVYQWAPLPPLYSPLCPVTCTGLTGATQPRLRGPHWVEISAPKSSTAVLQHPMVFLWIMKKGCSTGLMPQRMFFNIYYIATNHILLTFFDNPLLPPRKKIERCTLNGENRQVILQGVQYPYAMTVFQQDIFWTDWSERAIFRAAKDDGSGLTVIAQEMQYRPNDIHVYTGSKQESCSSSCQQFNGGCSHVCVSGKSSLFLEGPSKALNPLILHSSYAANIRKKKVIISVTLLQ